MTYSGLISFAIGFVSLFTGLIFTIIVTRQLTQEEFGTWSLIGGLITYVLVISPIISYWVTREIARNEKSGRTAIFSSSIFSTFSLIAFIIIALFFSDYTGVDKNILLLASILVPLEFFRNILMGISHGFKPQIVEYGVLIFELTKIPLAILLVYQYDWGITGAIISVAISYLANIMLMTILCRGEFKGKIEKRILKKWIKLSWLPLYPNLKTTINNSDVVIFTIISGSVEGLVFWQVARALAAVVNHSQKISKAVYPKMLSGGKNEFFQENFVRVIYFASPLLLLPIVTAKPAIFIMNPNYVEAQIITLFLVPMILLRTIDNVLSKTLEGKENVDLNQNATFLNYIKSRLFYLPTLSILQRISYISLLAITLIILSDSSTDLELVFYWTIIGFLAQIPHTIYLGMLVKKEIKPKIDLLAISKYMISSIIIYIPFYFFLEENLVYDSDVFTFTPKFLIYVIISLLAYVGLTYLIDKKTKKMVKSILNEVLKGKIGNGEK